MSDTRAAETTPAPHLRLAIASATLAGSLLLVPAAFYAYLNLDPPSAGPGDLFFGDGTGFVLAGFFALPAAIALAAAFTAHSLRRREDHRSAMVCALVGSAVGLVALVSTFVLWLAT